MNASFGFVLNGEPVAVTGVDPNTTLLAFLRARGRTGSKEACAEGECGACAVALVLPSDGGRSRYQAVNSCLVLLPEVAGGEVWTVEGVRGDELHPVQRLLIEHGGSQCGYCTPGFVMSLTALAKTRPQPTKADVRKACSGHLCRCGSYPRVFAAALAASQTPSA